ncbi:MAG: hypothetical protein ACP5K6_06615, partial [Dictyoglomus sp.]|uniref:hypothetical protein n=1 Tax=Dictyoglomus sp. TaxID=28205 RepID=UPI003D0FC44E
FFLLFFPGSTVIFKGNDHQGQALIFDDHYIIVKFPMGAFYDYYRKEKISRAEFLKQCEIWINGEKAVIEGDVIKVLGKEFKMDFTF